MAAVKAEPLASGTPEELRGKHRPSAHQDQLAKARKATATHDRKVAALRKAGNTPKAKAKAKAK